MTQDLKKLNKQLEKVEAALDKCRTSALQDGWQTQRHANKSRKWDYYAQEKMRLKGLIDELENKSEQDDYAELPKQTGRAAK